jgi:hypothetical protein
VSDLKDFVSEVKLANLTMQIQLIRTHARTFTCAYRHMHTRAHSRTHSRSVVSPHLVLPHVLLIPLVGQALSPHLNEVGQVLRRLRVLVDRPQRHHDVSRLLQLDKSLGHLHESIIKRSACE